MFIDIMSYDRIPLILEKVLDCTSKVQDVVASNIANAETPGYNRKEVSFQSLLNSYIDQIEMADPREAGTNIFDFEPDIVEVKGGNIKRDGNNVDIDAEMMKLTENQIRNNVAVQLLRTRQGILSYAITEGR